MNKLNDPSPDPAELVPVTTYVPLSSLLTGDRKTEEAVRVRVELFSMRSPLRVHRKSGSGRELRGMITTKSWSPSLALTGSLVSYSGGTERERGGGREGGRKGGGREEGGMEMEGVGHQIRKPYLLKREG